ncbi:MAG: hypothetical protein AMXMBFR36_30760 [Acidobacteriota bacterium]
MTKPFEAAKQTAIRSGFGSTPSAAAVDIATGTISTAVEAFERISVITIVTRWFPDTPLAAGGAADRASR